MELRTVTDVVSSMSYPEETFKAKQVRVAVREETEDSSYALFLLFVAAWNVPILVWNNGRQKWVFFFFFFLVVVVFCFLFFLRQVLVSLAQTGLELIFLQPKLGLRPVPPCSVEGVGLMYPLMSLSPGKKLRGICVSDFFPHLKFKAVLPSLRHNCRDWDYQCGLAWGIFKMNRFGRSPLLPSHPGAISCVRRHRAPLLVGRVSVQSYSLLCICRQSAERKRHVCHCIWPRCCLDEAFWDLLWVK